MENEKKLVALSAGHSPGRGARALDGTEEHGWNVKVLVALRAELLRRGFRVLTLRRSSALGYTAGMRKLAAQMREAGADIALELHFNHAANEAARGYEFLHWWRSADGERLANELGRCFGRSFPRIPRRGPAEGARSLWFHKWNEGQAYSGRGGGYCYLTPCPAVICEPGFGSNFEDWRAIGGNIKSLAAAYADGVEAYFLTS